jgi:hypothetical protein
MPRGDICFTRAPVWGGKPTPTRALGTSRCWMGAGPGACRDFRDAALASMAAPRLVAIVAVGELTYALMCFRRGRRVFVELRPKSAENSDILVGRTITLVSHRAELRQAWPERPTLGSSPGSPL